ncbi:MAG: amidoligase family protein [Pseudomonadota bacterium]
MLSYRPYGVELEVMPPSLHRLPEGDDLHGKVARYLNQHGVPAMSKAEQDDSPRAVSPATWSVVSDTTLRRNSELHEGTEVVSPVLQGVTDMKKLRHVAQTLQDGGFTTNMLTGLHVHHDANDLDMDGWKRLMVNFYLAEPAFDRLVTLPRRGDNNPHALSTRRTPDMEELIEHFDDELTLGDLSRELFPGVRSNDDLKLNVNAFAKHGTVEFRQHQGSICPDAIEHWVRLTQAFVDHAAYNPELISVNTGITDPLEAWEEVLDDRPLAQDRLLQNLLRIAPADTQQYYREIAATNNDNRPALARAHNQAQEAEHATLVPSTSSVDTPRLG